MLTIACCLRFSPTTLLLSGETRSSLTQLFAPLEKCVGHSLKLLDIVQKIWAPLGKLFVPPGVPSRLVAWFDLIA